ncbi:hypothetical protein [Cupriavidus sp. amp6]|uniref:hypothetical protein n=1 Tax=Cupriavidus sp. amp6 TaxID=388051 RepID=UPI00040BAB69|nr:hypothetical protein [Cupriavidus sp. amp6]
MARYHFRAAPIRGARDPKPNTGSARYNDHTTNGIDAHSNPLAYLHMNGIRVSDADAARMTTSAAIGLTNAVRGAVARNQMSPAGLSTVATFKDPQRSHTEPAFTAIIAADGE